MMKIIAINPIPFKKRMIEFLFDYLFILAYLVILLIASANKFFNTAGMLLGFLIVINTNQ